VLLLLLLQVLVKRGKEGGAVYCTILQAARTRTRKRTRLVASAVVAASIKEV
jgi:hypothetical protein